MITRTLDELSDFEKLAIIPQSYSRLSTFEDCEAKYFYQYILKEPDSTHPAALLGNVIHSVLEEQLQPNEEVTKKLEPLLLKEFDLQLCIQDRDHIIDDDLELKGILMLQEFVDRHEGETFEIVGKEQEFQIVVGTALFRGYIDRIDITTDGKIYIVDYKAQPLTTPILTPNGWTTMGDLSVGDLVVGRDGCPTKIEGVYPQGFVPSYRMTFNDGSSTVCSGDHLWQVRTLNKFSPKVLTTKEILDSGLRNGLNYKYAIPTVEPIQFDLMSSLPIDPYILGCLLGDGGLTGSSIKLHCEDVEILEEVSRRLPDDLDLKVDWRRSHRISASSHYNQYLTALRNLGLWGKNSHNKFIPEIYKRASVSERLDLLRGLMDTDGCTSTRVDYRTVSEELKNDVVELVRSLGGIPTVSQHEPYYKDSEGKKIPGRTCFVINVRLDINPFFLPRKHNSWIKPSNTLDRRIVSIERLPDLEMQCIRVSNEDGLYVTNDYIVTHNSGAKEVSYKSIPTNLQLGVYALAVGRIFPDHDIYAEMYYLRTGRQKGHLFTRDDLESVEERLMSSVKKLIDKRDFKTTANFRACNWCPHAKSGACLVGAKRTASRY